MDMEKLAALPVVTLDDVARHQTPADYWLVVDGLVLDLTRFLPMHPGGEQILHQWAGKDATKIFYELHRAEVLEKYAAKFAVARLEGSTKLLAGLGKPGQLSAVPYAEASVWQRWHSPYYNDTHRAFKTDLRKFFDEHVVPEGRLNETAGQRPSKELFMKCGEFGLLAARIGPGKHLKGRRLPGNVAPEQFDFFHELIAHEEMARMGLPGFSDGLACGMVIGLPPVLHFGKPELMAKVVPEVLSGQKTICLAITEPFVGSDVAGIQGTAVKSADGQFYTVNCVKKWITNGTFADYFTTLVRTGGPGMEGLSMMLIERGEGIQTKPIKTMYSGAAGTAYVIMEDVKVPVANLIGKENDGFKCCMFNFNHERWAIVCQSVRMTRLCVEECFKWAMQRKVFGKPLIAQPVIREKLAHMIAQVEGVQNWLELITFNMTRMTYQEQSVLLAGPIALLKLYATKVGSAVSDQACQIFGGRAITQSGMGQAIERYHRATKFAAILGGSEEIMAELGVKQAIKMFPKNARL